MKHVVDLFPDTRCSNGPVSTSWQKGKLGISIIWSLNSSVHRDVEHRTSVWISQCEGLDANWLLVLCTWVEPNLHVHTMKSYLCLICRHVVRGSCNLELNEKEKDIYDCCNKGLHFNPGDLVSIYGIGSFVLTPPWYFRVSLRGTPTHVQVNNTAG